VQTRRSGAAGAPLLRATALQSMRRSTSIAVEHTPYAGSAHLGGADRGGGHVRLRREQCRSRATWNPGRQPPSLCTSACAAGRTAASRDQTPAPGRQEDVGPTRSLRFGAGRPSRFTCPARVRRLAACGGRRLYPPVGVSRRRWTSSPLHHHYATTEAMPTTAPCSSAHPLHHHTTTRIIIVVTTGVGS
jgi:hypothetical protein